MTLRYIPTLLDRPSRVTGSGRQRHRASYDSQDPKEYYKLSTFNIFVDHVMAQMRDRFGPTQQRCDKVLLLIPAVTQPLERDKLEAMLEELADLYQTDLPASDSHILKHEDERYRGSGAGLTSRCVLPNCEEH